jgi:amidase
MSRHGIVTGSYYHDTPGPLARSMKDVSILLDIMIGTDRQDNLTLTAVDQYPKSGYRSKVVTKHALKGMKFGMPWNPYWGTNGVCDLDSWRDMLEADPCLQHLNSPGNRVQYEKRVRELRSAGAAIYNITVSCFLSPPLISSIFLLRAYRGIILTITADPRICQRG